MAEFLNTLLPALFIVSLVLAGLGIAMLIRKKGKFPDSHIHSNKYLREKDIHCVQKEDNLELMKGRNKIIYRNMKYIKK